MLRGGELSENETVISMLGGELYLPAPGQKPIKAADLGKQLRERVEFLFGL